MIVIACVDDNNGMLFHQRRQSRDIALYNHILQLTEGKKLFSKAIFKRRTSKCNCAV